MSTTALRRWPSRRFLLFTLALCGLAPLVAWLRRSPPAAATPYHFPSRELAELDRAVQARLAIVPDNDFGLARIGPRHGYFYPATQPEKLAIKNLQASRQDVIFYIVGRNSILKQQNYLNYQPVQGPVYITPKTSLRVKPEIEKYTQARFISDNGVAKDAPSDYQLVALSRRVYKDAALRNGTTTKIDKWNVVARPVAASAQQCVDCHNSRAPWVPPEQRHFTLFRTGNHDMISLGDTVGVALYCYRPAGKIEVKKLTVEELRAKPNQ